MKTPFVGRHPALFRPIRRASAILALTLATSAFAAPIGQFSVSLTNETLGNNGSISVDSGAKRIFASPLYTYKLSGTIKGESGTAMGALAPNGIPISKFIDSLDPGSSSLLKGKFTNTGGQLPVTLINLHVSGRRPVKGVPGLTSAKVSMDIVGEINSSGKCSLDVQNVKIVGTPKQKMGKIRFLPGSKLLISAAPSLLFKRANISFNENDGVVQIPVRRGTNSHGKVTVDFATVAGTANSTHFNSTSGTITFLNGETQKFIPVRLLDNALKDGARSLSIRLSNPSHGAVLSTADSINVTIHDDE